MSRILVVGSGASGVHFALTALERGHEVTMLDVGHQGSPPVEPGMGFDALKATLEDPVGYFLGERGEGVVYPAPEGAYYGHPPSKQYVFALPAAFAASASRMEPLFSFARGGFAEAWTAGAYAFNAADLEDFPIDSAELARCYSQVARRIGIGAVRDDLERFIPFDEAYLPPLPLDPHSQWLWDRYHARRDRLHRDLRFFLGRSRVATLSEPLGERPACSQLGRCLWGCPTGAIYSPVATLRECMASPRFRYQPGVLVRHFELGPGGRITSVVGRRLADQSAVSYEADQVALAAGALASSKIVLDSVYRATGQVGVLPGLMDNRQIHVPFLTPGMMGQGVDTASYQFHHLAIGIERASPRDYVHGQITTLKAASIHPIVQSLPFDLRTSLALFRATRAGLGVVNLNLPDRRRAESSLTVRPLPGREETELVIRYGDDPGEAGEIAETVRILRRALRVLGCLVPPGLTRIRPKGASVHYSGTLPMSRTRAAFTCAPDGRSHDFENLYIVDGACFPSLPAKNLTFTLMANATRIASGL
ncbi:MAG TPA: GMC oxidoreductase [Gemmatimonadales bacterium]|nr:GMC oxidoreductase [Gemmatimonadales bacterium]